MKSLIISEYRKLLRHLRALPSKKTFLPWLQREMRLPSSSSSERETIALLSAYNLMVSSVAQLKVLRSLDTGEKLDPREKIRRTAGRVGLSVPKVRKKKKKPSYPS